MLLRIGAKLVQRLRDILSDHFCLTRSILYRARQVFIGGKLLLCFLCAQRVKARCLTIFQIKLQHLTDLIPTQDPGHCIFFHARRDKGLIRSTRIRVFFVGSFGLHVFDICVCVDLCRTTLHSG